MRAVSPALAHLFTLAAIAALSPAPVAAHDIPPSVLVQAYIHPQGGRLHLVMRVPLAAMRDVVFPLREGGLLDLARAEAPLRDAALVWIAHDVELYEGGTRLGAPELVAARASLPSDRSFVSYDTAVTHVTGPSLAPGTTLYWNQALLDVLFDFPIRSDTSAFSIRPSLARLGERVTTVLRYRSAHGSERAFEYSGDPGVVRLDPSWFQAARTFVQLGFVHILRGTDHLLFLFCLVLPLRRVRPLIAIVTAFTVAHSITLAASALDLAPGGLWFPPLIETLIAASIFYMALENIVAVDASGRRWAIAFGFGLVHGFGFSFALRETLQFAGTHLTASLLAFNAGIELGQLLVLAILLPGLVILFRTGLRERAGVIVLSAIVAHTAWHWMIDRWDRLRQFPPPVLDVLTLLAIVRWTMAAVAIAAVLWALNVWVRPRLARLTPRLRRAPKIVD